MKSDILSGSEQSAIAVEMGTVDRTESELNGTSAMETMVVTRAFDFRVLPVLWVVAILFDPRGLMGVPLVGTTPNDLGITTDRFNAITIAYFVVFGFAMIPLAFLAQRLGPKLFLGVTVGASGFFVVANGLPKNYAGLIPLRIFLALFSAGVLPAMIFYLSLFYPRNMMASRVGILYSSVVFSGITGGYTVKLFLSMHGLGNIAGWRWFCGGVGIIGMVFGAAAYYFIPSSVLRAPFLTTEQKLSFSQRQTDDYFGEGSDFSMGEVVSALVDVKVFLAFWITALANVPLYFASFSIPVVTAKFGYGWFRSLLLLDAIYVVAIIAVIYASFRSDRYQQRGYMVMIALLVTIGGYLLSYFASASLGGRYFALYLVIPGASTAVGINIGWINNNCFGQTKRATAVFVQWGSLALTGIITAYINSGLGKEAGLVHGNMVCLSACVLALGLTFLQRQMLDTQNRCSEQQSQYIP